MEPLDLDPGHPESAELRIPSEAELETALALHEQAALVAQQMLTARRNGLDRRIADSTAMIADISTRLGKLEQPAPPNQRDAQKTRFEVTPVGEAELFAIARQVAWQRIQAKGYWRGLPGYCGLVVRGKLALACLRWHLDLRTCYAAPKAKAA